MDRSLFRIRQHDQYSDPEDQRSKNRSERKQNKTKQNNDDGDQMNDHIHMRSLLQTHFFLSLSLSHGTIGIAYATLLIKVGKRVVKDP